MRQGRPNDECPFPRPFPPGFGDCAAYRPTHYVGLDSEFRPLGAVMACANLEVASVAQAHRFYARCRLGDSGARRRWVAALGSDQAGRLRRVEEELIALLGPLSQPLWEAKGRDAHARAENDGAEAARGRLEGAADAFLARAALTLAEHRGRLEEVGLGYEACMELVEAVVGLWVEQPGTERPKLPAALVERFDPQLRGLLQRAWTEPPGETRGASVPVRR